MLITAITAPCSQALKNCSAVGLSLANNLGGSQLHLNYTQLQAHDQFNTKSNF